MKNNTVFTLAMSKLRFHKSRTLLTGIAIFLTTTLLMGIGTSGIAMLDMNRQYAQERSNYHAAFYLETSEQLAALSNHISVESMAAVENFATIINGKMNGFLSCYENVKNGLYFDNLRLAEGCFPEKEDEICSLPAFFERVGAEPVIGGKVTLSFRVNGKGELQTKEFTICGLLPDKEITSNIDDSRIAWGAYISKSLLESYEQTGAYQLSCTAYLRVYGEENLNYTEITDKIKATAADIGLNEEFITLDKQYLYTMTDPGTETMSIVAGICFIVILFSALVIYSIYYSKRDYRHSGNRQTESPRSFKTTNCTIVFLAGQSDIGFRHSRRLACRLLFTLFPFPLHFAGIGTRCTGFCRKRLYGKSHRKNSYVFSSSSFDSNSRYAVYRMDFSFETHTHG